jgi:hypothetical protein
LFEGGFIEPAMNGTRSLSVRRHQLFYDAGNLAAFVGVTRPNKLLCQRREFGRTDIAGGAYDHMRISRYAIDIVGGNPFENIADVVVGIDKE